MYITIKSGQRRIQQTTLGWRLLVQWKIGTDKWIYLKYLNDSNPVEEAKFASAIGIGIKSDFVWWVTFTLCKRYRVIAAVNERTKKGIQQVWCTTTIYSS